eukprot:CAMPEP_0116132246 /NCGR_PEP_ID=MMETSP0329-20121206/9445_1 /TAXON_ID=697910 /ORGANISM="Pseudo-nitzschia arenysensis, Strain B593" /LENGTH=712 /DNA_ID=CAMNT_0003626747 /DNA_START=194 /DNA_END=2332 /DNA_ORIENTATION=+
MLSNTNALLLVAAITGLVSAYSLQPGVSIASHSPARLGNTRIPSADFSSFPRHQMLSSTRRDRQRNEYEEGMYATSTTLYHMGHSHSHHDHHHSHDHDHAEPKVFSKQRVIRRLALILFCWVATCGTKLVQTATNANGASRFTGLTKSDWISFVVTTFALTSARKVTSAVQQSVENLRNFADGIRKHSSATEMQEDYQDEYHTQALAADKADADRVTWIGVAVNLLLSVGKLGVGITAHSSALVADAGHSLSDLVSDFITLWSVNVARLPPDEDHPYGHYKFEAIGSLFLSLTLLATGGSVGLMANKQLMEVLQSTASSTIPVQAPGPLALVMAGLSILSKEWLFRITKQVGERLRSTVVIANAWHHRSDAYSSVLALFSIGWAMVGFPAADAAAGILVAGMICMTGGEILVESVKQLSDSADSALQAEIVEILNELDDDDVIGTTSVRARQMGSAASVDVTVEIPSVLSTTASRAVEERVRQRLLGELSRRRGGRGSSSGIIATVNAKPFLEISPRVKDEEPMFAKLAFEKFDTDVDGKLTVDELKAGLEKTLNIELSYDRVQQLIEEFDVNNDGHLELEEMVTIDKFRAKIEALSREEMEAMPSTTYIEQQVRNQAQLMHPKIKSVEGVTVHYTSRNSVTVDVNIRITDENGPNALGKVREYARELKGNLETELQEIESARVYLDLNANSESDELSSSLNMTAVPSSLAP